MSICSAAKSETAFVKIASAFWDCLMSIPAGGCIAVALETVSGSAAIQDVMGVAGGLHGGGEGGGTLGG